MPTRRSWPRAAAILFTATTAVALALAASGGFVASDAAAPSADDIVARYVAARGGLKKIRAVETLRETGRITSGANREALVTRELKRPGRTRFELTQQGVTAVFVSNGKTGWKMSPFDGDAAPTPLREEAVKEAVEQADVEGPLVDWKAKGHQIELAGRETVGTHDAWKIKMTLKSGATRYEYIDVKTFYRVRAVSTRTLRGQATRVTMTFDDYKKVGGLAFPHLVDIETEGRPQGMRVVVDTVEVNRPISDARFEQPAASQP